MFISTEIIMQESKIIIIASESVYHDQWEKIIEDYILIISWKITLIFSEIINNYFVFN